MTKAEAIAMLKRIQEPEAWEPQINQAAFEAFDMAIKALEQQPCEDTISRRAAIDFIDAGHLVNPNEPRWSDNEVVNFLKSRPSAQPERKKGKWIYGEDEYGIDGYHCDKCGFFVPWDYAHTFINYIEDYNFCPYCGAEMDGG